MNNLYRNISCQAAIAKYCVLAALGIAMALLSGCCWEQKHDPQKLLELRRECLKDDPSAFAEYCNEYAEKYSRIDGCEVGE